ncbi:DUF4339 domain-containing protein [Planctomicrobium sp. SH527]|uniref:DUF4339 domain-containing protein n=1 Tax=Planctomicrobium sp. SH527 TaxID=3448123 RepID=UPI003F5B3905
MRRLKSRWYCFTDDEIGPFTLREVVQQFSRGALQPGDLVRRETELEWERIEAVAEITQAVQCQELRNRPLIYRLAESSLQFSKRWICSGAHIAFQLAIWCLILNVIGRLLSFILSLFR